MKDELSKVRDWAKEKIKAGSEPPWAWYQYMKLVETVDTILDGMAVTDPSGQEHNLRLVDDDYEPDKISVKMPI